MGRFTATLPSEAPASQAAAPTPAPKPVSAPKAPSREMQMLDGRGEGGGQLAGGGPGQLGATQPVRAGLGVIGAAVAEVSG